MANQLVNFDSPKSGKDNNLLKSDWFKHVSWTHYNENKIAAKLLCMLEGFKKCHLF